MIKNCASRYGHGPRIAHRHYRPMPRIRRSLSDRAFRGIECAIIRIGETWRRAWHLFAVVLIAGCVTVGNRKIENPGKVAAQIKPGATTKNEVRAIVGEPSKTEFADTGDETWEYVLVKSQVRAASFIPIVGLFAGGADMQNYSLTVRFRPDGVVKNVGYGQTNGGGGGIGDK